MHHPATVHDLHGGQPQGRRDNAADRDQRLRDVLLDLLTGKKFARPADRAVHAHRWLNASASARCSPIHYLGLVSLRLDLGEACFQHAVVELPNLKLERKAVDALVAALEGLRRWAARRKPSWLLRRRVPSGAQRSPREAWPRPLPRC